MRTVATEVSELLGESVIAGAASAAAWLRLLGTLMESCDDLADERRSLATTSGCAISRGPAVVEETSVLEGSFASSSPSMLARIGPEGPLSSAGGEAAAAGGGDAGRGGDAGLLEDVSVSGVSGGMSGGGPGAYGVNSSDGLTGAGTGVGRSRTEGDSGTVDIGTEVGAGEGWSVLVDRGRIPGAAVFMDAMLLMEVERVMGFSGALLLLFGFLRAGLLLLLLLLAPSLRGVFGVVLGVVLGVTLEARGDGGAGVLLGVVLRGAGVWPFVFFLLRSFTLGSVHDGDRYSLPGVSCTISALRIALRLPFAGVRVVSSSFFFGVEASCALATLLGDRVGVLDCGTRFGEGFGVASMMFSGSFRTGDVTLEIGTGIIEGTALDGL